MIALADLAVALLIALAIVALVSRRLSLPYTTALVVFGLIVALLSPDGGIELSPDIVLVLLVPGLVFEAAFRLDIEHVRPTAAASTLLAVPGVLVMAGLVTIVLHWAVGLPLGSAFLVGAMVSATDPVAVISTMRSIRAPERLRTLVEAESLFNDGTSVVLFTIALASGITLADGVLDFAVTVLTSLAFGLIMGGLLAWLGGRIDDVHLELTLTIIAAYGVYLLADRFGQSGIIATVVAGMVMGDYGRRAGMSARTRVAVDAVWGYLAFVLTAVTFLLIGLAITPGVLVSAAVAIVWAVVAVVAGRAIVVYGLLGGLGRTRWGERLGLRLPTAWAHVLFWAGLRGAIAVALALSLPTDLPDRALLQGIVFGVVLFTLVVQGSTTGLVLRRSGLAAPTDITRSDAPVSG